MSRASLSAHPWGLLVLLVVAMLGLSLVTPAPASVQTVPESALATEYFNAVLGESPAFLIDQDAVLHTPEGSFVGVDGPAGFGDALGASFSDVDFALQSVAEASDGFLIASFTLTGINTGSYHGMAANCAGVSVPGVALLKTESRTFISESWSSGTDDVRLDLPDEQSVNIVTEQWIEYDSDAIASQIEAYNALDSTFRPDCSANPNQAPEVVPGCVVRQPCDLP